RCVRGSSSRPGARRGSPLVVGIALLIQPVVAGAVGWIVYGERLGAPDLVGVAMVAVALVLVRRNATVAPAVVPDGVPPVAPAPARPHLDA
ncbi:MAG: hypothetical protein EOP68_11985, partial [Sphingomonas sp.]